MSAALPVGILEIAGRLGVRRVTVDQWLQRDLLPPPEWTVGGRPAWDWSNILRWAVETGRLMTVADLAAAFGLPASEGRRAARFAGAFRDRDEYTRTGRVPPRWAGLGLDATFTRGEIAALTAEWNRSATSAERVSHLSGGKDPEIEEIAAQYRAGGEVM